MRNSSHRSYWRSKAQRSRKSGVSLVLPARPPASEYQRSESPKFMSERTLSVGTLSNSEARKVAARRPVPHL
jgi:hypothetical protein